MANWFKPCPAIAAAAVAVIHWGKLCRGLEGKHRIISQHFPLTAMDDGGGGLFEVRRGVGCNEKAIKFPANYVHFCVCADKLVFTNRRKKIKKKFRFRFSPLAVPKQNLKQVPNGRRQRGASGCDPRQKKHTNAKMHWQERLASEGKRGQNQNRKFYFSN